MPITVFLIALDGEARAAEGLLDAQELERADRFRFPHLRERFVLAHGVLRLLLGRFAKEDPRSLRFAIGEKGKPRLEHLPVTFNLSHSGTFAAYALAEDLEVGIDVEELRALADLESLARRSFSAGEFADLLTLDGEARVRAFYDCWTRKEAVIKALGLGLSYPLDRFRVSLRPGEVPAVLEIEGDVAEEWQMHDLGNLCTDPEHPDENERTAPHPPFGHLLPQGEGSHDSVPLPPGEGGAKRRVRGRDLRIGSLNVEQRYAGALAYRGERRAVEIIRGTAASVLDEFGLTGDIGSQDFQRKI